MSSPCYMLCLYITFLCNCCFYVYTDTVHANILTQLTQIATNYRRMSHRQAHMHTHRNRCAYQLNTNARRLSQRYTHASHTYSHIRTMSARSNTHTNHTFTHQPPIHSLLLINLPLIHFCSSTSHSFTFAHQPPTDSLLLINLPLIHAVCPRLLFAGHWNHDGDKSVESVGTIYVEIWDSVAWSTRI